jgi:hypothetical protein
MVHADNSLRSTAEAPKVTLFTDGKRFELFRLLDGEASSLA